MVKVSENKGTVHMLPADLKKTINTSQISARVWNDITPLARNEYICWVESAKKPETRIKRILWATENLAKNKRRPCCWAGCPHRQRNGK